MRFRPQLTPDEAFALSSHYDPLEDEPALSAGRQVKAGDYSRAHFETIFRWKTKNRGKSRLLDNTDAQISDALRLATVAREPRSVIAVLIGLHGVNTPVASAIATMIHPDNHTILDFRALQALGNQSADRSIRFHLQYLAFCIALAHDWNMSLRQLDRALWQWSKERSPSLTRQC